MKISIIGSGAMGSLFGGKMALQGHEVILYDVNQAHVDTINKEGLRIEELATGDSYTVKTRATTAAAEAAAPGTSLLFVHTGGAPALFAYEPSLTEAFA